MSSINYFKFRIGQVVMVPSHNSSGKIVDRYTNYYRPTYSVLLNSGGVVHVSETDLLGRSNSNSESKWNKFNRKY